MKRWQEFSLHGIVLTAVVFIVGGIGYALNWEQPAQPQWPEPGCYPGFPEWPQCDGETHS